MRHDTADSFTWHLNIDGASLVLPDIDLAKLKNRFLSKAPNAAASWKRFQEIWQNDTCRTFILPRIYLSAPAAFGIGMIETLGPDADFHVWSADDILTELLLDTASTLLLFQMHRAAVGHLRKWLPQNLHIVKIRHPETPAAIRRVFEAFEQTGTSRPKNVVQTPHGSLAPPKSRCALIELGDAPAVFPLESRCFPCDAANCLYDQLDICPHSFFGEGDLVFS